MSSSSHKKTSSFIVTVLIGLIIISFMFTGYQSISGSPSSVGVVGSHRIEIDEFQRAYQSQMNFYQQIYRNKKLSKKELDNVRDTAFNSLVSRKLSIILTDELGIVAGDKEIKQYIKNQDYFKTSNKFDVNKYKALLAES